MGCHSAGATVLTIHASSPAPLRPGLCKKLRSLSAPASHLERLPHVAHPRLPITRDIQCGDGPCVGVVRHQERDPPSAAVATSVVAGSVLLAASGNRSATSFDGSHTSSRGQRLRLCGGRKVDKPPVIDGTARCLVCATRPPRAQLHTTMRRIGEHKA
eukprot:29717-Chlamydomonas_euryale.AAC.13